MKRARVEESDEDEILENDYEEYSNDDLAEGEEEVISAKFNNFDKTLKISILSLP